MIDIVTIYHNETNLKQAEELASQLLKYEAENVNIFFHSNMENNIGFARGCNAGAKFGSAEIIGFINPDAMVHGPFVHTVESVFKYDPDIMVTGKRFNKPQAELDIWGVSDWVCGAAFFVRREWFEELGGFDENYVWSWEETDFIRQTESLGKKVVSVTLPIMHSSPGEDSKEDSEYKRINFEKGREWYNQKWQ